MADDTPELPCSKALVEVCLVNSDLQSVFPMVWCMSARVQIHCPKPVSELVQATDM